MEIERKLAQVPRGIEVKATWKQLGALNNLGDHYLSHALRESGTGGAYVTWDAAAAWLDQARADGLLTKAPAR